LKEFQKVNKLESTGVVDFETWAALCPPLKMGDSSKAVTALQHLLNKFDFAVAEDGVFCVNTKNAVAAFQRSLGLIPDGIVGNHTWREALGRERVGAMTVAEGEMLFLFFFSFFLLLLLFFLFSF
jgi:peptidoglycan hydrolase-like protein with peptidoglycan-binding domain